MVKRQSAGKFAGQKDKRIDTNKKYYGDIKKEHYTKDFFTFKDSMVIEEAQEYKHSYRLILYNCHPTLASVGPDDGIATILTDLYEQGHVSGHMKDIGTTELADAINYCEGLWEILGQLRNEFAAVTLLDNPTFDDATVTSVTTHAFYKPESYNTFIETLEARNLIVPDFLLHLLDKLTGIRFKLHDSYEIYGSEVPAGYLVMGVRVNTLAVMETSRNTMASFKGSALQFFNKYGIGYKSFTTEMATKVSEFPVESAEATFWFDTVPLTIYGKTKLLTWYGSNTPAWNTADWTAWKKWIYKGQVPDIMMFTPCFGTHDAVHNIYGGLFTYLGASAVEGRTCFFNYGIDDGTPSIPNIYSAASLRWLPYCWFSYGQDDLPAAGEYELALVGTELTASVIAHNDPAVYAISRNGAYGRANYKRTTLKTISKTALNAFLLKKMISVAGLK